MNHSAISRVSGRTRSRGIAAVELALVLPLLLLFAFATVDFGRAVHASLVVSNAARTGAEYGGMHRFTNFTRADWESRVQLAIEEEMQRLTGYSQQSVQVALATTDDDDDLVQVQVDVTYPFQTIVSWPGVPGLVTLHHQVTMRQFVEGAGYDEICSS